MVGSIVFSSEKVLVLGGSPLQADLVDAVKRAGLIAIVVDGNKFCSLAATADKFINFDFANADGLKEIAISEGVRLILTIANEVGNYSAAVVSEELGLTYNPPQVVCSTVNKRQMKDVLAKAGIPTPKCAISAGNCGPDVFGVRMSPPLVVKPSESSGGRGVKLVDNVESLDGPVEGAGAVSRDGFAIIEEYVPGIQFSVETVSSRGVHHVVGITSEFFVEPPWCAETEHMFPADINEPLRRRIHNAAFRVLRAFCVQVGACHIELRVTPNNEIKIIEVASRMGGWRSELIRRSYGLEYTTLLLQSHKGRPLSVRPRVDRYCLVKMIYSDADVKRRRSLKGSSHVTVSPITWLKSQVGARSESLLDSAGYYFVEARNLVDAKAALK